MNNSIMSFLPFPSIEQFRHVLKELPYIFGDDIPNPLRFRGTVKLHGTHADIVRHIISPDEYTDVIQSKNRILTAENDNRGCFSFLNSKNISDLLQRIVNIHSTSIKSHIMVCGEYCGEGIQSKVAICKLKRMFVIFAIKIDNKWVDMEKYKDVDCESESIYNIMNFPTYEVQINLDDLKSAQDYMIKITDNIDKECPFAKKLSGVSGVGEGVVWTCIQHPTSRLWFKTKGETHCIAKTNQPIPIKTEQVPAVNEFIENTVTETRLHQGIEYLIEFGNAIDITSISTFVSWVVEDILREERDTIKDNMLTMNDVRKGISRIAGSWYKTRLQKIK